jgi:hypothetical protein
MFRIREILSGTKSNVNSPQPLKPKFACVKQFAIMKKNLVVFIG